jgi:hypothetical protein
MPNIPIDVPLPDNVKKYLATPHCIDIQLPKPDKVQLCLPLGGKIAGVADVTKAFPDECTLTFSLLLQLGPILANLGCFIKLLKLIKPLTDLMKVLSSPPPDPVKLAKVVPDFLAAIPPVVECFASIAIGVPLFIKDLLLLIAKILHCVAGQLKSIAGLMGGLQLSIGNATAAGNTTLLAQLQCAQENASRSADAAMTAIEPITLILSLAEPLFGIAGVNPIVIPTFGSGQDAQALQTTAQTLEQISAAIIQVAEALPSC